MGVKGDATCLEKAYQVETANTVDLRTHARSCWVSIAPRSLAGMTATVLAQSLHKNATERLSTWTD